MNSLKKLRMDKGYNQDEFAQELNVSKTLISKIETGAIAISSKLNRKIITHFNLPENWQEANFKETNEKSIKEQMYGLIKHNFRDDLKMHIWLTMQYLTLLILATCLHQKLMSTLMM